jgi:hypothetical protein
MMRKGHNDQFIAMFDDNNVVWKSAKNEAFYALAARVPGHGRKGKEAVFYNINGRFNRLGELGAEALSLLFIPSSRRFGFLGGLPRIPGTVFLFPISYPDEPYVRGVSAIVTFR